MQSVKLISSYQTIVDSKLTSLFDNFPKAILVCDLDGKITYSNKALLQLLDFNTGDLNRHYVWDFQTDETEKQKLKDYLACPITEQPITEPSITTNISCNAQTRLVEVIWDYLHSDNGELTGFISIISDITQKKQSDDKLKLFSNIINHANEGIIITNADKNILDVNQAFTHITGYKREEVLGKNPKILKSGIHDSTFYTSMWKKLNDKGYWFGEIWNKRKNGEVYAEQIKILAVENANTKIQNYVAILSDITTIKKNQEHLKHITHYDVLTNLPNRVLLSDRLNHSMAQTKRHRDHLTLAYLDLDGFKEINDSYGHQIGDQLLMAITHNLKLNLRDDDTLARIGGDEFVVILSNISKKQDCIPLINRLLNATSNQIPIGNNLLSITASIGVTFFPQTEKIDAEQLLRQADQAMYLAKQSGKNCYKIFNMSQDKSFRKRHESIEEIKQALINNEFVMYYQPKINMRTGEVIGVEALIRWIHPKKGLLLPIKFLPLIEGDSISIKIGDWVISNTLSQLDKWHKSGLKLTTSINISALHLQQSNFVNNLENKLSEYPDIENNYLELEILETSALDDIEHVSEIMTRCQKLGVNFALDDFGTGYSSLTYLKRLPASKLKIDQTFVSDMLNNSDDLAIVEGILGLSSAFKRQPIAEGVETIEDGIMLQKLGCDIAQGNIIAKPMPAEDLNAWIDNWQQPLPWKNIKIVNRNEVSLLYAVVEHLSWIKQLDHYIKDQTDVLSELSVDQCHYGIWLRSKNKQKNGKSSLFKQVEKQHKKIHRLALKILDYKKQNDNKKLSDTFSLLRQTSTDLLSMTEQLLEQ